MKSKAIPLVYCLLLAFLTLWVFSFATSPYYNIVHHGDSALFQLMGRAWTEGHLPYVAIWDLKGPVIFLVNAIGYWLTGSATGVFMVQWVFLSLTLIINYCFLREQFSMPWSLTILLLLACSYAYSSQAGNCVEEYNLPLLSLSYYLVYKWLVSTDWDDTRAHPVWFAFVYGLTLGFALMTRLTNALGVCAAAVVIAVWLVVRRSWKNLGDNILAFAGGFAVVVLPFVIYFAVHGALWDMWYGTFLYNLDYTGGSTPQFGFRVMFVIYVSTWLLFIIAAWILAYSVVCHKKFKLDGIMWLLVSSALLLWFHHGMGFAHYGLLSLPLVTVGFVEAKRTFGNRYTGRLPRYFTFTFLALFAVYSLRLGYVTYKSIDGQVRSSKDTIAKFVDFMKGTPPKAESYKSFVAYNVFSGFYLHENILPACKYSTGQTFESAMSKSLPRYIHDGFSKGNIRWILVYENSPEIDDILCRDYYVYKTNHKDLTLYERNK